MIAHCLTHSKCLMNVSCDNSDGRDGGGDGGGGNGDYLLCF